MITIEARKGRFVARQPGVPTAIARYRYIAQEISFNLSMNWRPFIGKGDEGKWTSLDFKG